MACSSKPASLCTSCGCGSSNCPVRWCWATLQQLFVSPSSASPKLPRVCKGVWWRAADGVEGSPGWCFSSLLSSGLDAAIASTQQCFPHIYFCIVSQHGEWESSSSVCESGRPRQQFDSCCVFSCCGGVQALHLLPPLSGATSKWRPQLSSRQPPTSLSGLSRFTPSSHFILSLFSFETLANSSVCCQWNLTQNERLFELRGFKGDADWNA